MVYYVYLLCNRRQGTLYTGVTNDLERRVSEHKQGLVKGFTKKYGIDKLVYYECFEQIEFAIMREKQLKRYSREWKYNLIERDNPHWDDLLPINTVQLVITTDPGTSPG